MILENRGKNGKKGRKEWTYYVILIPNNSPLPIPFLISSSRARCLASGFSQCRNNRHPPSSSHIISLAYCLALIISHTKQGYCCWTPHHLTHWVYSMIHNEDPMEILYSYRVSLIPSPIIPYEYKQLTRSRLKKIETYLKLLPRQNFKKIKQVLR